MSNVVLVWELGAELGHVTRLNALAHKFAGIGHQVTCVLSNPDQIHTLFAKDYSPPFNILRGPGWPQRSLKLSREPANLSEVLLAVGYHNANALAKNIKGWQSVLAPLKPDVIVYDYAPTALLASRDYQCRKIGLDDPFSKPPSTTPLPSFNQDPNVGSKNLSISESKLLATINLALNECALAGIDHVYDLFATDKSFLLSLPELDPFCEMRSAVEYVGLLEATSDRGVEMNWRSESPTQKMFAYLKPGYPNLPEFLSVVHQLGVEAKMFIPGVAPEVVEQYAGTLLEILDQPYDVSKRLHEADLVVCHGGHGTVLGSVMNGVPVLIIPLQQEQLTTAKRCIDSGLGFGLGAGVSVREKILSKIQTALDDNNSRNRAHLCSVKYRDCFKASALERVTQYVGEHLDAQS